MPTSAVPPYILLGQVVEDPAGFYSRPGSTATYRQHHWAPTYSNALRLYAWYFSLMHDQEIAISGHLAWQCKVKLVGKGTDPTSTAQQAISETTLETVATA